MITLQRKSSDKDGTRGKYLNLPFNLDVFTLEPETPVLPSGRYLLQYYRSYKFQSYLPRYIDLNDPLFADRCLAIHWGNIWPDTQGCTLVGSGYTAFDCADVWPNDPIKRTLGKINGLIDSRETWFKFVNSIYLGKIQQGKNGVSFIGGTEIEVRD